MEIREITTPDEKRHITRLILESLPDWFGIPEAREEYIEKSVKQPFFAAFDGENAVGFLYLAETGRDTAELYVMGVLKEYHRRGVGKMLFAAAKQRAKELGYSFCRSRPCRWGSTLSTTRRTASISPSVLASLRYSRRSGTSGTRVKST